MFSVLIDPFVAEKPAQAPLSPACFHQVSLKRHRPPAAVPCSFSFGPAVAFDVPVNGCPACYHAALLPDMQMDAQQGFLILKHEAAFPTTNCGPVHVRDKLRSLQLAVASRIRLSASAARLERPAHDSGAASVVPHRELAWPAAGNNGTAQPYEYNVMDEAVARSRRRASRICMRKQTSVFQYKHYLSWAFTTTTRHRRWLVCVVGRPTVEARCGSVIRSLGWVPRRVRLPNIPKLQS